MMDGRGDVGLKASETNSGSARNEEEEEEDDDLSRFVNNIVDQAWESIQERMRHPLTKSELIQMSVRLITVVCELVFELRVPGLVDDDQVLSDEAAIRSFELHSHSEENVEGEQQQQEEEATQSTYNRSSPIMVRPITEDHLRVNVRYNKESPDDMLGRSDSQLSALSALEEVVQQVIQSPTAASAHSTPLVISAEASAEQSQEQVTEVTEVTSSTMKAFRRTTWQELEQFFQTEPWEVISLITESLDIYQEEIDGGVKTGSDVEKILKLLAIEVASSAETREDKFDRRSLDDTAMSSCWWCWCQPKSSSPLQGSPVYPVTVCSQKVNTDLSSRSFRCTSLMKLNEYLTRVSLLFPFTAISGEPYMSSVASELLEIVANSVNQLCRPQPRMCVFPWQRSKMTTVSKDQVAFTAVLLNLDLKKKLLNFLKFHKDAADKLREGEIDKQKRASSGLSRRTDKRAEDTQKGRVMLSSHTPSTESREFMANTIARGIRSFLVDIELLLKQDDGAQGGVAGLAKLEKMISQGKLSAFSKLLTDKLTSEFYQQQQSQTELPVPTRRVWSDSELSCPRRHPVRAISPPVQVYIFVEEAVKHLLSSFIIPPPSWGMGHTIQVQSSTSPTAKCAGSVENYDTAISGLGQLMVNQVMGNVHRKASASKLRQEVGGLLRSHSAQGEDK